MTSYLDVIRVIAAARPDLPRSSPFWLLLLVCLQHALTPDDVEAFARGEGALAEAAKSQQLPAELARLRPSDPSRQLATFLATAGGGRAPLTFPERGMMLLLLQLVRHRVINVE